jgi:hypothetical protein
MAFIVCAQNLCSGRIVIHFLYKTLFFFFFLAPRKKIIIFVIKYIHRFDMTWYQWISAKATVFSSPIFFSLWFVWKSALLFVNCYEKNMRPSLRC